MMDLAIAQEWIIREFMSNDILKGLIGGGLFGSLLFTAKSIPGIVKEWAIKHATVEVVVNSENQAFEWVNKWMSRHEYSTRARRLRLVKESDRWVLGIGYGYHLMWYGYRPLIVNREKSEGSSQRESVIETFSLRMLGRSQEPLRKLLKEVEELSVCDDGVTVQIWMKSWWEDTTKTARAIESVILRPGQLDRVIKDAEWFFGAAEWYASRGVPHRRGYLLHGPPGTGKTSLAFALASHLKRPLHYLNLGSIKADESLYEAFASTDKGSIVLIEDIDSAVATHTRTDDKGLDTTTLSGILNAIDGIIASEGRLLIMTTNHPDKLDPALIRPGRIDLREEIGLFGSDEVARMVRLFFPGAVLPPLKDGKWSPAAVQGVLLNYRDDLDEAIHAIQELEGRTG